MRDAGLVCKGGLVVYDRIEIDERIESLQATGLK